MENLIDDDEMEVYTYADIGLASPRHEEDDESSSCSDGHYTYLGEQHDILLNAALSARGREKEAALLRVSQSKIHMYPTRRKAVFPLDKRITVLIKKEHTTTNNNNEVVAVELEENVIGQAVAVTCRDVVIKNLNEDGTKKVLLTFHLDNGKSSYFDFFLPREWTTRSFVILLAISIREKRKKRRPYISCVIQGEYKDVNSILANGSGMLNVDVMALTSESFYNSIVKGGHYCDGCNTNF